MPAYAAFLRGVSPLNAKMSELKECFEKAGFENVRTLLGSGNVVLRAPRQSYASLVRKIESAMDEHLGKVFPTTVRTGAELAALVELDPFAKFRLAPQSKRIVTLLHAKPRKQVDLPIELHGARILELRGQELFSAYVPSAKGPVFMSLIEKTFGKDLTTRTWDTLVKVTQAAAQI